MSAAGPAFLQSIEEVGSVAGLQALAYHSSSTATNTSTEGIIILAGDIGRGIVGGITDDLLDDGLGGGDDVHTPTHHTAQTVIDLLAVFGAMFVAGVIIILITVYFSKMPQNNNKRQVKMSTSIEMDQAKVLEPDESLDMSEEAVRLRNSRKRELYRLESLVRHQVHIQWQASIDNYSKLRKRQSQLAAAGSPVDAMELAECSGNQDSTNSSGSHFNTSSIVFPQHPNKELQDELHRVILEDDFGGKPSLWRKAVRSVVLKLRGQEQHKDVYVMPEHMRAQLKQMYVY